VAKNIKYRLHKKSFNTQESLSSEKTIFVENIAQNKPSRATPPTTGSRLPKYANDGNSNTYYIAGDTGNRFWVVDLENIFQLHEINAWHPQYLNAANSEICNGQSGQLYTGKVNHTASNRICLVSK